MAELSLGHVFIDQEPVVALAAFAKVLVVNMIRAFVPCFDAALLKCLDGPAKAAPKGVLTISTDATSSTLLADLVFGTDVMRESQVLVEMIPAMAYLTTLGSPLLMVRCFGASPNLILIMLRVLVSLPVVLAAKCLLAMASCTAPRSRMPFFMLPLAVSEFIRLARGH